MSIQGGILFDYKYYKYLGAFGFVLASRNNGTIESLFVCTKANYGSSLSRATDEIYTDVELPLKPLLFHVLISRPYVICPRAAP